MTLYLVGLGLHDPRDISLKGYDIVRKADDVYLESYTSTLSTSTADLESFFERAIIEADRTFVEQTFPKEILPNAKEKDIVLLVIGDPLSATTHTSLRIDAYEKGVPVRVVHNASVLTAVGLTGLELYRFGKVTSIPFENDSVTAPLKALEANREAQLHTLFLLDLTPAENRFMTVSEAASYLIGKGTDPETMAVGCAGLGADEPEIVTTSLSRMKKSQLTQVPQCLIIPGKLHFLEEEALQMWRA